MSAQSVDTDGAIQLRPLRFVRLTEDGEWRFMGEGSDRSAPAYGTRSYTTAGNLFLIQYEPGGRWAITATRQLRLLHRDIYEDFYASEIVGLVFRTRRDAVEALEQIIAAAENNA